MADIENSNRIKPKIIHAELIPVSSSKQIDNKFADSQIQSFYDFVLSKIKYWHFDNIKRVDFNLDQFENMMEEQSIKVQSTLLKQIETIDQLKILYNQAIKPDEVHQDQQDAGRQNSSSNEEAHGSHSNLQQNFISRSRTEELNRLRGLEVQESLTSLNCTQYYDILCTQEFKQRNPRNQIITWKMRTCVFTGLKQLKYLFVESLVCIYGLIRDSFRRICSMETLRTFCQRTEPHRYANMLKDGDYFNIIHGIRASLSIPFYMVYTLVGFPLYSFEREDRIVHNTQARITSQLQRQVMNKINQDRNKYLDTSFFAVLKDQSEVFTQMDFNNIFDEQKLNAYIEGIKGDIKFQPNEQSYRQQLFKLELFYITEIEKQLKSMGYSDEVCTSFRNNFYSFVILKFYQELLSDHNDFSRKCLKQLGEDLKEQGLLKQAELVKLIQEEYENVLLHPDPPEQDNNPNYVERPNDIRFDYMIIDYSFSITTNFFFWKLIWYFLFIIQVFFFILYHGYDQAFNGCFGFKVVFFREHNGHYATINQIYHSITESVRESVESFEREPNDGILDKCMTRVCHRVYNYGFKYFIIGIVIVQILLRLLFLFMALLLIILTPVAAICSPLIALFVYLFNIFLYDFLSPEYNSSWNIPIVLPVFNLLFFRLMIMSIGKIFVCIVMFFLYYFLSFIILVGTVFIILFRIALNIPIFLVLYLCARIPNSDTWAATKVSVQNLNDIEDQLSQIHVVIDELPQLQNVIEEEEHIQQPSLTLEQAYNQHMSKIQQNQRNQEYQILTQEQVVLLVGTELKRILIKHYLEDMIAYIEKPQTENELNIKNNIPFVENPNLGPVGRLCQENTKALLEKFNKDMNELERKIPVYTRRSHSLFPFKFSEEEYNEIFKLVRDYLTHNENQFHHLYWHDIQTKSINQNNYDHLTQYYLSVIFLNSNKREANVKEKVIKSKQPIEVENVFPKFCPVISYKCNTRKFIHFKDFIDEAFKVQQSTKPLVCVSSLSDITLLNSSQLH